MKNIQLIPTKDKGRITKHNKELHIEKIGIYNEPSIKMEVFNMYITSDEEIKEGDWYFNFDYNYIKQCVHTNNKIIKNIIYFDENSTLFDYRKDCKKIILTTDLELQKDGIQAIDDDFLEWFVENPSCEEVEIGEGTRYEDEWIDNEDGGEIYQHQYCCYKIIIPKEEHILEEAKQRAANYMSLKGALEPKDVVLGYKTSLDAQMLNSQYVDFSNPNADKISSSSTTSFKQERMYSEEDMIRFAEFVATHPDKNRNVYGEMLHSKSKYDDSERTIDLLEQFKKK